MTGEIPSCSCLQGYIGGPPSCRPECVINADCQSNLACIREQCANPCDGVCGINAQCRVINHVSVCTCTDGYTGDPFSICHSLPKPVLQEIKPSPCTLCGANTLCENEICKCLPDYSGDPYLGCRPECTISNDCPKNRACSRNRCIDPCPGLCGENAECSVVNHIPICVCIAGYSGNAFVLCSKISGMNNGNLRKHSKRYYF